MRKINLIFCIIFVILVFNLCACNDNKTQVNGETSGEIENVVDNKVYNNGGEFVKYKDTIYYREYNNQDFETESINLEYDYNKENRSTNFINEISEKGTIKNAFSDKGYGNIYIIDDKFFATDYNNSIYVSELDGKNRIELCKGEFIFPDETNHKMYYRNSDNILYTYNTQDARITKILDNPVNVICIENENIYYYEKSSDENIELFSIDINTNELLTICTIDLKNPENEIKINKVNKGDKKLLFMLEYYNNDNFEIAEFYSVDLDKTYATLIEENADNELIVDNGIAYYQEYNKETNTKTLKELNIYTNEFKTSNLQYEIQNNVLVKIDDKFTYFDGAKEVEILSKSKIEEFKQKYIEDGIVNIRNVQKVDDTIIYLVEVSKEIDNGYRRIASEEYMYNGKGKNVFLYFYEGTKEEEVSGEQINSGDNSGDKSGEIYEPLAENEMYLNIDLTNKGIKEKFEVRVEEVGGLIIGKRVEYEGTHTRKDGMIRIKVTKEVGAMINVYIDNKIDSQMLIEN